MTMTTIQGTLKFIIFNKKETGYTVGVLETGTDRLTVVGSLPDPEVGKVYRLTGDMTVHPRYGRQFKFSDFEEVLPTKAVEIEAFLSSGVVPGIGPKTAAALTGCFGDDTLRVLGEEPERLTEVPGIGPKTAARIADAYQSRRAFTNVAMKLREYGVTTPQAMRLCAEFGESAVDVVRSDPYALVGVIRGIGFRKADAIAEKTGVPRDSEHRIRCGIREIILRNLGNGNTCMPYEMFREEAAKLLDLTRADVDGTAQQMIFDGDLVLENIEEVPMIFPSAYAAAEKKVAANLKSLLSAPLTLLSCDPDRAIAACERAAGISFSGEQKQAIRSSLNVPAAVITGGPGTGKTTILQALLSIFESESLRVELAAPTGRAAQRMKEVTAKNAATIHRLLEYSFDDDSGAMYFGKTEEDPLDTDVVIVDEASMIDLMLMKGLTDALRPGTRLILVGDADQLPSVGAGMVLLDLMESGIVPVSRLEEIHRQAAESSIVVNAHRIRDGEAILPGGRSEDFFVMNMDGDAEIRDTIVGLVTRRLPDHYHCDRMRDIQVITPVHGTEVGTDRLNECLQQALNPASPGSPNMQQGGQVFRPGDKVMQTKNDYALRGICPGGDAQDGVYNGDVGFVDSIDPEQGTMTVVYDGNRFVTYTNENLEELTLAYAITVHKSQGSEFPYVVMPLSSFPPMIATRNLLYTAVTRGKNVDVLVGSFAALSGMIANDRIRERYSGLRSRLSDLVPFVMP